VSDSQSAPKLSYPVPWDLLAGHWRNYASRTPVCIDEFTAAIVRRMDPPPVAIGTEHLPASARFVLAVNHYQRKGLWIVHTAAALTRVIRERYGPGDPPVRWVVTANWPRIKVGPFSMASPGDFFLPRVADAWSCYPVSFHGTNPAYTARSLRRILREAPHLDRPLGLFPEGVQGAAGAIAEPLPGVERLLLHLTKAGMPVVPAGVSENGRLVLRFGELISTAEIRSAGNAAQLVMERIKDLATQKPLSA
jgi:hypothetical protein